MTTVAISDRWVQHPQGRIGVRQWTPAHALRNAAPIVLIHDSLGCIDLWRGFPEALSQSTRRTVIAYDRLGFGRSDARSERPSLDFVAQEAAEYFPLVHDALGFGGFVAMGHSVGGGMAIEIAARMPERCEALVTIAAQVFAEDRTLSGIRAAREQFADPAQIERLARYHGNKAQWVVDAWVDNWLDPAFTQWTLAEVLPSVQCPVYAIHGELDEYGSSVHPETIGRLSAGPAKVDILPKVGHVPHREQQALVCALLANFLDARPDPAVCFGA